MTKTKQTWKIGDCLDLLPSIEDKSIQMILCDLPYGTTACSWDEIIDINKLWHEYKRIINDNGIIVLFAGFKDAISHISLNSDIYRYDLVWEKSNPANIVLANKRPMRYHENMFIFYKNQPIYNKQMIKRTDSERINQAHKTNYVFGKNNIKSETGNFNPSKVNSEKYDANLKNPSSIIKISSLRGNSKQFIKHKQEL